MILALLLVQAMCDLHFRRIHRISSMWEFRTAVWSMWCRKDMTEEEFQTAQFIMTDDEADCVESLYKKKDGYYELKDLSE